MFQIKRVKSKSFEFFFYVMSYLSMMKKGSVENIIGNVILK